MIKHKQHGRLEVIWGGMFCGKSEELLRRLKRAKFAKQEALLFKPAMDNRYSPDHVVSHDQQKMPAICLETPRKIFDHISEQTQVIGIDEAQFFDIELVEICAELANQGFRVIVAGLDQTFEKKPFGPMPYLACEAEQVDKLHAICTECGQLAHRSQRLNNNNEQVLLGEKDSYRPLCRHCFNKKI